MNVMLFSRIIAKSGVGNYMKLLSNELARQGHYVVVVSTNNEMEIGGTERIIFEKLDNLSKKPIDIIKNIKHLRKIIMTHHIDIVHCHHRMAAFYMRLYNSFYHIPIVYTLHLADVPCNYIYRKMTFVGDKAMGVSSEVSIFLVDKLKVPKDKVVTVFNGVEPGGLTPLIVEEKRIVRKKWDIPEGSIVFSLHSRIEEVKNQLLIVEAVKRLDKEERKKVIILCSGVKTGEYYKKVMDTIENYKLKEYFRFIGWADTREVLGISDFLICPSRNEGFLLTSVEAFFMKIPVFRTETAGFREQKYCFPISMDDPEITTAIMRDIYQNGVEKYYKYVQEAYLYAMENFTVKVMAEKIVQVYRDVGA